MKLFITTMATCIGLIHVYFHLILKLVQFFFRQASVATIQPVEHAQSKVVNIDLKVGFYGHWLQLHHAEVNYKCIYRNITLFHTPAEKKLYLVILILLTKYDIFL